jgi:hypothetical protein
MLVRLKHESGPKSMGYGLGSYTAGLEAKLRDTEVERASKQAVNQPPTPECGMETWRSD